MTFDQCEATQCTWPKLVAGTCATEGCQNRVTLRLQARVFAKLHVYLSVAKLSTRDMPVAMGSTRQAAAFRSPEERGEEMCDKQSHK